MTLLFFDHPPTSVDPFYLLNLDKKANFRPPTHPFLSTWLLNAPKRKYLLLGSFHTASKQLPIWKKIANEVFDDTKEGDFVEKNGLYDDLIIGYSFKENLGNYKFSANENKDKDFQPILTTRGICYTFNSQTLSSIWRPSNVTMAFIDLFPTAHIEKFFGGTGRAQGSFLLWKQNFW